MKKIVFDAGHGGDDPGAAEYGLEEKFITLELMWMTEKHITSMFECEILMTRGKDVTASLDERTDYSNDHDADFFYSFHVNASPNKTDIGDGFESYIHNKLTAKSKTAQIRDVIHGFIVADVMKKHGIRDRGKKKGNLHVLRETKCPAMLGEYLFIDNKSEANRLKDSSFLNELAVATAQGIGMALDLKRKTNTTPPYKDDGLYVIRAGAFKDENNAKRRLMQLRNAGFSDSYIRKE